MVTPFDFYNVMSKCQCDSNVERVEKRFKNLEAAFENQVTSIR